MTTLAGRKIRRYREAQTPKLTRSDFGSRVGASFSTVQGWEECGHVPRPSTLARVVATGIVSHADWFLPADCPLCGDAIDAERPHACSRREPAQTIDGRAVA